MRLSFQNADWRRVLKFYSFYAVILLVMAWPFCIPSGKCSTPFEWLWVPYLAGSNTARFVMVVGFEFYVSLMVAICVRFKPRQVDEEPDHDNQEFINKIGVVIPCHKSAQVIGATLELALHHFPPENIVVMDNGRSKSPLDNCLQEVRKVSSEIMYKWVPVGHKAIALMLGSRLLPPSVEYLLLIDDDVLIPKTMRFDSTYFENKDISAVAYSIAGCGPDLTPKSMNYVQRLQDFEFKLADTYRCFVSQYSTVMFAHGAVGLWRRDRFKEIYSIHPGLPIGEDGWAGRLNLIAGYAMKHDSGPVITTEVPPNMIPKEWWFWMVRLYKCCLRRNKDNDETAAVVAGYGSPDLFNQRARRWDMNSPRRFMCHARLFFTYGWKQFRKRPFHRALIYNIIFRLSVLRGVWSLFGTLIYISYLARVLYSANPVFIVSLLLVLYALQLLKYVVINFCVWRNRKDLRVSVGSMLLMPLYRKIMILYRVYGYFRSVLMYVPIVKTPDKVLGERDELHEAWGIVQNQTEQELLESIAIFDDSDNESVYLSVTDEQENQDFQQETEEELVESIEVTASDDDDSDMESISLEVPDGQDK